MWVTAFLVIYVYLFIYLFIYLYVYSQQFYTTTHKNNLVLQNINLFSPLWPSNMKVDYFAISIPSPYQHLENTKSRN